MGNKKEVIILLVSMIIVVIMIIFAGYFLWNNMIFGNLEKTTEKAAKAAGVEIDKQDNSSQGQINAVRDMMGKIQEKKNAEIENELK